MGLDDAALARVSADAFRQTMGERDGIVVSVEAVSDFRIGVRESCPDE